METCVQLLAILLDYTPPGDLLRRQKQRQVSIGGARGRDAGAGPGEGSRSAGGETLDGPMANLFCSFVSRLQLSEVC